MKTAILLACTLTFAGCATPVSYTQKPMTRFDKDTEYAVDDRHEGFYLAIYYSRYQFIPESSAVATACKAALTAVAYDVAEHQGKRIAPLNEQRIRISMGRNEFSGITSCSASVPVDWAKQ